MNNSCSYEKSWLSQISVTVRSSEQVKETQETQFNLLLNEISTRSTEQFQQQTVIRSWQIHRTDSSTDSRINNRSVQIWFTFKWDFKIKKTTIKSFNKFNSRSNSTAKSSMMKIKSRADTLLSQVKREFNNENQTALSLWSDSQWRK